MKNLLHTGAIAAAIAMLLTATSPASAGVIFSDNFEGPANGDSVDTAKWGAILSTTVTNSTTPEAPPEGTQAAQLVGTPSSSNARAQSKTTLGTTTMFMKARVLINSDTTGLVNGASMSFLANTSGISARLAAFGVGGGEYQLKVLRQGGFVTLPGTYAIGSYDEFIFGVQITNTTTGEGKYTVIRNGDVLADEVTYMPFSSGVNQVFRLELFGDLPDWRVDDLELYDTVIPEPSSLGLGLGGVLLLLKRRR